MALAEQSLSQEIQSPSAPVRRVAYARVPAKCMFCKPKGGWTTTSKFKAELTASDGSANDGFSNELGLSADGKTIVVGAAGATIKGNTGQGAAYVFVKPAAGWKTATQTAKTDRITWARG